MGAGYELRPVTIDRPAGQRPAAIIVAVALLGSLVLLKPWDLVGAGATDSGGARAPVPAVVAAAPLPAAPDAAATEKPSALGSLARHSGTWGVGASGQGPHNEAEPWADWTAVTPVAVAPSAKPPDTPSKGPCDDVPTLPTEPLFVAISHDSDVPVDRRVVAWWWDAGTPTPLADELHQVTTGDRGIAYVIRDDGEPWPAGRYEFHVVAGDQAVALTVCLFGAP
jgi:hypothetical protein